MYLCKDHDSAHQNVSMENDGAWACIPRMFEIANSNGSIHPQFHISHEDPFSPPVVFVIRVAEWCFTYVRIAILIQMKWSHVTRMRCCKSRIMVQAVTQHENTWRRWCDKGLIAQQGASPLNLAGHRGKGQGEAEIDVRFVRQSFFSDSQILSFPHGTVVSPGVAFGVWQRSHFKCSVVLTAAVVTSEPWLQLLIPFPEETPINHVVCFHKVLNVGLAPVWSVFRFWNASETLSLPPEVETAWKTIKCFYLPSGTMGSHEW